MGRGGRHICVRIKELRVFAFQWCLSSYLSCWIKKNVSVMNLLNQSWGYQVLPVSRSVARRNSSSFKAKFFIYLFVCFVLFVFFCYCNERPSMGCLRSKGDLFWVIILESHSPSLVSHFGLPVQLDGRMTVMEDARWKYQLVNQGPGREQLLWTQAFLSNPWKNNLMRVYTRSDVKTSQAHLPITMVRFSFCPHAPFLYDFGILHPLEFGSHSLFQS